MLEAEHVTRYSCGCAVTRQAPRSAADPRRVVVTMSRVCQYCEAFGPDACRRRLRMEAAAAADPRLF